MDLPDEKWAQEFRSTNGSCDIICECQKVSCSIGNEVVHKTSSKEWVDEFVDITDSDVDAFEHQQNFWAKLEKEWQNMAEQNKLTGQHPWLDDYEEVRKKMAEKIN